MIKTFARAVTKHAVFNPADLFVCLLTGMFFERYGFVVGIVTLMLGFGASCWLEREGR